jgi:diguanylate cyclase (GGDEF)-like protein
MLINNIKMLWHRLTNPKATDDEIARREYMTRVILAMMGFSLSIFTLIILLGWTLGWFDTITILIIAAIDIPIGISWLIAARGVWRPGSYVAPIVFFLLGVYGSVNIGIATSFSLGYALSILLTGMLRKGKLQWIFLGMSLITHISIGALTNQLGAIEIITATIPFTGFLVGISLLQWFGLHLYKEALQKAQKVGEKLKEEIAEREQVEREKKLITEAYVLTLQHMQNNVFRLNRREDGTIKYILYEGKIAEQLGLTTSVVYGKTLNEIAGVDVDKAIYPYFKRAFAGEIVCYETELRGISFTTVLSPVENNGQITEVIGSSVDTTEQKLEETRLKFLSTHDILTGLFNRYFFEAELERLQNSRFFPLSMVLVDVDDLKVTNDRYGHTVGDELLKRVALVLRDAFRSEDIIARIGGDEFIILLPETSEMAAQIALERLEDCLKKRNNENPGIKLNVSFGLATGEPGCSLTELLHQADTKMYTQKTGKKPEPE